MLFAYGEFANWKLLTYKPKKLSKYGLKLALITGNMSTHNWKFQENIPATDLKKIQDGMVAFEWLPAIYDHRMITKLLVRIVRLNVRVLMVGQRHSKITKIYEPDFRKFCPTWNYIPVDGTSDSYNNVSQ